MNFDSYQLYNAIGETLPYVYDATLIVFGLISFIATSSALVNWVTDSRRGEPPTGKAVRQFFVGSILFSFTVIGYAINSTIFAGAVTPTEINSWNLDPELDTMTQMLLTIVSVMNVIGWITLGRGIRLWYVGPNTNKPDWGSISAVLIATGSIMINIYAWTTMLGNTIGAEKLPAIYQEHYESIR